MKVLYLGNFENKFSDSTEKHISYAFKKLGHEVIEVDEHDFDIEKIISQKPDLFLFHKGGQNADVPVEKLIELLNRLTCKKVMWYFDKFWKGREAWGDLVIPFCDYAFVTDGSYMRRRNFKNVYYLNQGIGNEDMSLGTLKEHLKVDIAFTGTVYGEREAFTKALKEVYGDKFRVFNSSFGRNLYDLAASVKIFIAPKHPSDDHYWSSRVYMILGSGGFLLHPKLEGLKQEFKDGEHLVMYRNGKELREKIDYYLEHEEEREKIRMAGYKYVTENLTYQHRIEQMLKQIYG